VQHLYRNRENQPTHGRRRDRGSLATSRCHVVDTYLTESVQSLYSVVIVFNRRSPTVKTLNLLAAVLLIVGGLNWGLVSLAEFDLVAWLTGQEVGGTSALSRIVYGLVGLAAVYGITQLITRPNESTRSRSASAAA